MVNLNEFLVNKKLNKVSGENLCDIVKELTDNGLLKNNRVYISSTYHELVGVPQLAIGINNRDRLSITPERFYIENGDEYTGNTINKYSKDKLYNILDNFLKKYLETYKIIYIKFNVEFIHQDKFLFLIKKYNGEPTINASGLGAKFKTIEDAKNLLNNLHTI